MQAEFGRRIIENLDVGYNRYELMQRLFGARPQKTPAPLAKKPAQKAAPKPPPRRVDDTIEEVDIDDKIKARLPPPKQHYTIKPSPYYMNNREKFIGSINTFFHKYRSAITKEQKKVSCKKRGGEFSLLTHQKIINDYMNLYSPYRGLLLFHGLGSGKTCSSISIAEGFKHAKKVVVMTPASLQMNYRSELKKCGDALYKYNQFWEFVPIENDVELQMYSSALSIPRRLIKKLKLKRVNGIMLVNVKKKPNYNSLSAEEKELLDKQLDMMIENKYSFLNYNGMRPNHLRALDPDKDNPFDDKVIIVDEVHNLVSMIANKLKQPDSLSMKVYHYLMAANNARLVFLTGTPIINYPNELAILFNMLRGYIKTYSFQLVFKKPMKKKKAVVEQIIHRLTASDVVQYINRTGKLIVTRNPFGFINNYDKETYSGVELNEQGNLDHAEFVTQIDRVLKSAKIERKGIEEENHKALPDDLKTFKNYFIEKLNGNIKNAELFKKRILGLTSYFRSGSEKLMPAYSKEKDFNVVKIPMSEYQLAGYEEMRKKERKSEKRQAQKRKRAAYSDVFESSSSTYRLFSRAYCNFVFPKDIPRPFPEYDEGAEDVEEKVEYQDQITQALFALQRSKHLTKKELATYSPKFLALLGKLELPSSHLIYTQFRTMEGVGILRLIFLANGYEEFKIAKNDKKEWYVVPIDFKKPAFVLYTGTEDAEEKEIVRNIFNNAWDQVPDSIVSQLSETRVKMDNKRGQLIKCFMITSSGAEGITLKNVRHVHIVEPYWHSVRVDQVIGRARRICSHEDLPKAERKMDVFLYLMTFSAAQKKNDLSVELKLKDVSKEDGKTPLTSDEHLFVVSNIKEMINSQLLMAVKESAIDCEVFQNKKEPINCMSFGEVHSDKQSFLPSYKKEDKDTRSINKKTVKFKVGYFDVGKKRYAYNTKTMDVYDYSNFKTEGGKMVTIGNPIKIGKLTKNDDGGFTLVKK